MKEFELMIILIGSVVWLVSCVHLKSKSRTIKKIHRTGEAIAVDDLIYKFEKEHRKFYEEEINDGDYLGWSDLNNKNLSQFCRMYLNESIPSRTTMGVIGIKTTKTLHYGKGNSRTPKQIDILQCKVRIKHYQLIYYITRAPEPNCVYALKSAGDWKNFILTIVNKYCDFENKPLINKQPKRVRPSIVFKIHHNTGQPIAKNEYLMEYELQHQELLKKEGLKGECIEWPYAVVHPNLDIYCYQYMGESAPGRNREGVKGSWKTEKIRYQIFKTNAYIMVTTIICQPAHPCKVRYYMTRAPETNCAFALLRQNRGAQSPAVIIFKHCDFEILSHRNIISAQASNVHSKHVIPKSEVKEETWELLQLFSKRN